MLDKVRNELLELTRVKLQNSVTADVLIIQASLALEDIQKSLQSLSTRFREWYEYYYPELSKKNPDHAKLIQEALKQEKIQPSVGGKLSKKDISILKSFAKTLNDLHEKEAELEKYISESMQDYCPNIKELAGAILGAKLLASAHGLSNLAKMSASKLQLLGAEKALFRHMLGQGKSPKHGIIINHPFVLNSPREKKGKAARLVADKLSIAAKLDYFKGDFLAPQLKKDIEEKLK